MANRQQWVVQHVTDDGTVYAREAVSGRKNPRTVTLPTEYVAEHAHLSYAATAYGVQGTTVNNSHTLLSEVTSAAGVYVGMTRGRETNRLHVVAADMADARAQFIEAMERDSADRGLDQATRAAQEAVRGLIADGPVRLVTEELARLDHETERAEQAAERWEQIAARLDAQRAAHRIEDDESAAVLRKAEEAADRSAPRSPGRSPSRPSRMGPPTSPPSSTRLPPVDGSPALAGSASAKPVPSTGPRPSRPRPDGYRCASPGASCPAPSTHCPRGRPRPQRGRPRPTRA